MSVRCSFWKRCWLVCDCYKDSDEPMQRNCAFPPFNLNCTGIIGLSTENCEAGKSKYLDEKQLEETLFPIWLRFVKFIALACGEFSVENSIYVGNLFDLYNKYRKLERNENFKTGRFDLWGTKIKKRPFHEGEFALSKYCENSKEKRARDVRKGKILKGLIWKLKYLSFQQCSFDKWRWWN